MNRKEFAIYRRIEKVPAQRGWVNRIHDMEVRVMARADGYAMVRLPRCMPFVVPEKTLTPLTPTAVRSK
jgi:hypothetical protein